MKKLFSLFAFAFCVLRFVFSQDTTITYMLDKDGRIREHNADFLKMVLDVKFKEKEGKVIGNVKYDFKPIQFVFDTLFLNAPNITIKNVLLDGKETPFTTDSNGVTIKFLQAMSWNNTYKLEINYEATPRKGIYFIGWNVPDRNSSSNRYYTRKQIWTQGQGIDNRYWFPCYDDVNDKMITETIITFDSSYTVISNGVLKSKKINAGGSATWHYAMSKPMVPYLVMIGIDKYKFKDYKSKNGMVSRQYYYADHPETVEPTYQKSAEMMDYLVSELQVKYPWETYCNVPVQDFMYGAMENTSATVFTDFYVMDWRGQLERNYVATNAHELTHQWFGDYITEYGGSHHWLHESFATYYSKQFMRKLLGEDQYEFSKRGEQMSAINADKADRFPVASIKAGSARHYPKGSACIDMLRYVVGDSVFRKCVTNYLKKHAYENVSTHDFMFAFMETAGLNLDWFFDEWIYRSGFPSYEVSYVRQKNDVVFFVKQTQQVDELTGYFKMPLVFEVYFKDGTSSRKTQWLSRATDTIYVSAPEGKELDFTLFDPASNVLKTVTFEKTFEELTAQAERAPHAIDRSDALVALQKYDAAVKRDFLIRLFSKKNYTNINTEIIQQLSKDTVPQTIELFRAALHSEDFLVRRSVLENLPDIPKSILHDAEALLEDSSFYTIESALRKLCKIFPERTMDYLSRVETVYGLNNNVRITYLELLEGQHPASGGHLIELENYLSNRYEFRTRVKAMESIERMSFCNEIVIENLFNASLNSNGRLSGPAVRTLKILFKIPENFQLAKGFYSIAKWEDWQKKILEGILKG